MRLFIFLILALLFSLNKSSILGKTLELCDLSDLSFWEGLCTDPNFSYNGLPAPKWEQSKSAIARTENIPHDWSQFSCLEFAIHSKKATGSAFMLALSSENLETEGID
ncbi:MAG: hypothetical protein QME62_07625, partial [Armatimonadota bacterium]|nr:hypothetical protein [Armatimonadota bacterium]